MEMEGSIKSNGESILQTAEASSETPPGGDPEQEATLYDADAIQRIPVYLPLEGERYEAVLITAPLTDAHLISYARLCARGHKAEGESGEMAAELGGALEAICWLFDQWAADIEGVGEEGEEKPADWRGIFDAQSKAALVDRGFLLASALEPPAANKSKRPSWNMRAVVTRLRVPFNGGDVITSHTLKKADAKAAGDFAALLNKCYGATRGFDARMEELAAAYDRAHVAHEGYKGRVPMNHKATAYIEHMTKQAATIRKN